RLSVALAAPAPRLHALAVYVPACGAGTADRVVDAALQGPRTPRVAVVEGEVVALAARGALILVELEVLGRRAGLDPAGGRGRAGDCAEREPGEEQRGKGSHEFQIVV